MDNVRISSLIVSGLSLLTQLIIQLRIAQRNVDNTEEFDENLSEYCCIVNELENLCPELEEEEDKDAAHQA